MQTISTDVTWDSGEKPIRAKSGAYSIVIDEPIANGGTAQGPSPLQYFATSLGGCFIALARLAASEMGVSIDSIRCRVEGDIDLNGLTGKYPDIRPGFQALRMKLDIRSKEPADKIKAIVEEAEKRCPVKNCLDKPVPISVSIS